MSDLFQNGPGLRMAEMAVEKGLDPANAESPTDLLLRLLPGDNHLS